MNLNNLYQKILLFFIFVLMTIVIGCGTNIQTTIMPDDEEYSPPMGETIFLTRGDENNFTLFRADGSLMVIDDLQPIGLSVSEDYDSVAFEVIEENQTQDQNQTQNQSRLTLRFGKYKINIYKDKHDIVSPCLKKKRVPHLNLKVKNTHTGQYICNLHLMVWMDRSVKFGVWNKSNGYCRTSDATYESIKIKVRDALRNIYIPSWAAAPIASVAAYLTVLILVPKPIPL